MREINLEEFLAPLTMSDEENEQRLTESVTTKFEPVYKAKFDELQAKSKKRFGKQWRELTKAFIDLAYDRIA